MAEWEMRSRPGSNLLVAQGSNRQLVADILFVKGSGNIDELSHLVTQRNHVHQAVSQAHEESPAPGIDRQQCVAETLLPTELPRRSQRERSFRTVTGSASRLRTAC